jgi:hypothetical protein
VRLESVAQLNAQLASGALATQPVGDPAAQDAFRRCLNQAGFRTGGLWRSADVVRLQSWIGSRVSRAAPPDVPARGYALLVHAEHGGGLLCGGMSDVLREALVLLGVPARTVQLYESGFWPRATHVVSEAFVEGSWRVFDPTFNATYEADGAVLGVSQIQMRLRMLGPTGVAAVSHGRTAYPVTLEREGMGWRGVFANAYVSEVGGVRSPVTGLPPWRYWTGPTIYYFGDGPWLFPAVQQWAYAFVVVVLPAVALASAVLCAGLATAAGRAAHRSPSG